VSGWRDKLSRSDSLKKEEPASPAYHGKKRSSITKARVPSIMVFVGIRVKILYQAEKMSLTKNRFLIYQHMSTI
jgi:hypothetical protein